MYLASALSMGKVAMGDLDLAISRIFTHFIALGELEGPEEVVYVLCAHNGNVVP